MFSKLSTKLTLCSLSYKTMAQNKCKSLSIIGVSGVTNGGKTSLCEFLMKHLGSEAEVFNMDDYFYPDEHPSHIRLPEFNGHANWEALESVDWEKLHSDVTKWEEKAANSTGNSPQQRPVLLIEGILIFNHKPLLKFYDKKYFFTLTKDQCWERRKQRIYEPADPVGYFDGIVWPMYIKNKEALNGVKDLVYLDGAKDMSKICLEVLKDIQQPEPC